jgi:Ca2+-binding EF-hand superfamily protein
MKMLGMSDFEEFDINKDGKVSKEEIRERREIAVQSMDLNGDEKLSAYELMQQHTKRAQFSVKRMIKELDSNGDGSLSFAELKKSRHIQNLGRMFDRLDNDNDGYISKDEVQRVRNLLKR